MDLIFFLNAVLFGAGLAMDAFSVSVANALAHPDAGKGTLCAVAATFSFFQFFMPMLGWVCVHTIIEYFGFLEKLTPWAALLLLLWLGVNMIAESRRGKSEEAAESLGFKVLLVQGVATSIDALSVGLTMADFSLALALIESLVIAAVTFAICLAGCAIGKTVGGRLAGKAGMVGGIILICIGVEILIKGVI